MPQVVLISEDTERAKEIAGIMPTGVVARRTRPCHSALYELLNGTATAVVCVLEDLRAPEWSLLAGIKERCPLSLIVVCTGDYTAENAVQALKMGVCEFISSQAPLSSITNAVSRVLSVLAPSGHYLACRLDRFIAENLSDVDLSLSAVSERFAISESYASKLLNREMGVSFRQRLAHHRHLRAQHLLRTTSQRVGEVAVACGYRRHSRFSETFGRLQGISPRLFRRRERLMERELQ